MYISSPIFNGHAVASNETKFTSKTNIVSLVLTQKGLGPPVTTISTQQKSELEGNQMNLEIFFFLIYKVEIRTKTERWKQWQNLLCKSLSSKRMWMIKIPKCGQMKHLLQLLSLKRLGDE